MVFQLGVPPPPIIIIKEEDPNLKKWFNNIQTSYYFGDGSSRDNLYKKLKVEWNEKEAILLSSHLCEEDRFQVKTS
jgi:hypothetical protein